MEAARTQLHIRMLLTVILARLSGRGKTSNYNQQAYLEQQEIPRNVNVRNVKLHHVTYLYVIGPFASGLCFGSFASRLVPLAQAIFAPEASMTSPCRDSSWLSASPLKREATWCIWCILHICTSASEAASMRHLKTK